MTCKECSRPVHARGLCNGHYQQLRRGVPLSKLQERNPGECTYTECYEPRVAKGLCNGHYIQLKKGQALRPLRRRVFGEPEVRFWAYVVKGPGCWKWTGSPRSATGYGSFNGTGAHRYSYELHNGPIPKGLVVRHLCHNPSCVNPDHLRIGTYKENAGDSVLACRHTHGVIHGNSKLTDDVAQAIYQDKRLRREIAATYNVSVSTVNDIKHRRTWKHIHK